MRVSLFVTCLADQLWPAAGVGAVEVLRRVGCAVEFDERQTCCGQPAFNTGYRPEACSLARRLIEIFESSGADAIVSPSGSCTAMLHHYEQLFEDAGWRARARSRAPSQSGAVASAACRRSPNKVVAWRKAPRSCPSASAARA